MKSFTFAINHSGRAVAAAAFHCGPQTTPQPRLRNTRQTIDLNERSNTLMLFVLKKQGNEKKEEKKDTSSPLSIKIMKEGTRKNYKQNRRCGDNEKNGFVGC